jgi:hypothetical protein
LIKVTIVTIDNENREAYCRIFPPTVALPTREYRKRNNLIKF